MRGIYVNDWKLMPTARYILYECGNAQYGSKILYIASQIECPKRGIYLLSNDLYLFNLKNIHNVKMQKIVLFARPYLIITKYILVL